MAKIYRVFRIKLNQLVLKNVHHRLRPTNKEYLSAITVTNIFQCFYLQNGGKNQLA